MKHSVYIETTIISYLVSKPSRDLIVAAHQSITLDWWETVLPFLDSYISPIVVEEISRGDETMSKIRMEKIRPFKVLEVTKEIHELAQTYFTKVNIPEKAHADAYHLATAAWHGMDFLVSWNCTHIVNGRVKMIIDEINQKNHIKSPILCTPEELMEI